MDDLPAALERLIERHLGTLRTLCAAIRASAGQMREGGEAGAEAVRTAYDIAHQLAGGAGSIGFAEVGLAARALEERLRPLAEAQRAPNAGEAEAIAAQIQHLDSVVRAQTAQSSNLHARELGFLRGDPTARKA